MTKSIISKLELAFANAKDHVELWDQLATHQPASTNLPPSTGPTASDFATERWVFDAGSHQWS